MVVRFSADPAGQAEIERTLTLADEVIRFKVMVRRQLPREARRRTATRDLPPLPPRRRADNEGTTHMASDNQITVVGNLTDDPELRYTANGAAVANFTVAHSTRIRDAAGNWSDGDTSFFRVNCGGRSRRTPPSRSRAAPASS